MKKNDIPHTMVKKIQDGSHVFSGGVVVIENQQSLKKTLQIRDTYLLPLQYLQVSLLKKVRELNQNPEKTDPLLRRTLNEGQKVIFDIESDKDPRGPSASNVVVQ